MYVVYKWCTCGVCIVCVLYVYCIYVVYMWCVCGVCIVCVLYAVYLLLTCSEEDVCVAEGH